VPPPRLRHATSTAAASESLVSITSIEGHDLRQLEATCSCPAGAPGRLGQLGRCRVCGKARGGGGSADASIDEGEERGGVSIRQHTAAYGSIRQHTSIDEGEERGSASDARLPSSSSRSAYVSIRQHTSSDARLPSSSSRFSARYNSCVAYVSIRQQTAADGSRRQHMCNSSVKHASAYVSTRQHMAAYGSIRKHKAEYV
jgi:hypothetical protein